MAFKKQNKTAGKGFFTEDGQKAKARAFFAANPEVYVLGKIFDEAAAKTIAAGGTHVETEYETSGGEKLTIANSEFSLATLDKWSCPLCGSAHGTAIGASNQGKESKPSVKALQTNVAYYLPKSKTVRVISKSCFENWVEVDYKHNLIDVDEAV